MLEIIERIAKVGLFLSVWALSLVLFGFVGRVFWEIVAAGWNLLG